jgi:thiol:disulfide interchange protein
MSSMTQPDTALKLRLRFTAYGVPWCITRALGMPVWLCCCTNTLLTTWLPRFGRQYWLSTHAHPCCRGCPLPAPTRWSFLCAAINITQHGLTICPAVSLGLLLQWEHLDISRPLTSKDFDATLHRYPIVVINFYAPWCPFCKRMEPSWESASRTVHDRYPEGTDGRIRFAKVCVDTRSAPRGCTGISSK